MTSAWTCTEQGFVEEPSFSTTGRFTAVVRPRDEARGAVLLCPSLGTDVRRNHRREVLLARHLAVAGLLTLRFHYRGSGSSEGLPEETTAEGLLDDARAALGDLRAEGPGLRLGIVGCRFGAMVTTALAGGSPEVPLVLWDPPADAASFARELVRAERLFRLADPGATSDPSVTPTAEQLPSWVGTGDGVLRELRVTGLGPVLVAELGRSGSRRTGDLALEALRDSAARIEVRSYPEDGPWTPPTDLAPRRDGARWPLLDDTVSWLTGELGAMPR